MHNTDINVLTRDVLPVPNSVDATDRQNGLSQFKGSSVLEWSVSVETTGSFSISSAMIIQGGN